MKERYLGKYSSYKELLKDLKEIQQDNLGVHAVSSRQWMTDKDTSFPWRLEVVII